MTDRLRASAVTATQIDAFMAFITYASVTVLPRYTRPLCLQRPERFILAGHRAAITPCDRFWHNTDISRAVTYVRFRGASSTGRRNTCVISLCWGVKLQGLTWSF